MTKLPLPTAGSAPSRPAGRVPGRVATACLSLVLLACLFAAPSSATVGPPVKVRLLGKPVPAIAGQPWHGTFEISAGAAAELADFQLEGDGWTALSLGAPSAATIDKQRSLTVEVSALPLDPAQPLVLSFRFGGRIVRKTLDLSPANAARAEQAGAVRKVDLGPADVPGPGAEPVGPGPALDPEARAPAPGTDKAARYIRVHGRFVYWRDGGPWVGADHATVKVHDTSMVIDQTLAQGTTDEYGWYDLTFLWNPCSICSGQPDLHVEFVAENDRVKVEDATWELVYKWNTPHWNDYAGTDLDLGTLAPEHTADYPALHILTNVTRTWRWLLARETYDCPNTDVQWPDGDTGAYYTSLFHEIHLSREREWSEETMAHEYGHHWMQYYSYSVIPDYCNSVCDNAWPDCGHCMWCPEDEGIAWTEAFPNWMAHVIPSSYAADYGLAANDIRDTEGLDDCWDGDPDYWADPLITEGFVTALLQDIYDSAQDAHPHFPGHVDSLAVGYGELFLCVDLDTPTNVLDFLHKFKNRYAGWAVPIWKTAKNCGYEIDLLPPGAVTGLTSSSHAVNVASPDPTVDLTWNFPWDDASGIDGYAHTVAAAPGTPPPMMTIGDDVTSFRTPTLAPGTYYFNLRPVDRAGHWCGTTATFGPIVIRAAEPSNLAFKSLPGWTHVALPRGAADASATSCPAPTSLPGNAASTYWNVSGENTGDVATSTYFSNTALVDGAYGWSWGLGIAVAGHAGFYGNNLGPFTVRGGRHVLETRLDATERISELNENDNRWARQWVWTPLALSAGVPVTRNAPPPPTAGWDAVTDGSFKTYNCDGLRFTSSGWWNALTVRATSNAADYDLRLHNASTGATDGFASYGASSAYAAGYLDAVIVNRNLVGWMDWDAGVINYNAGTGSFVATHVASQNFVFGDSLTVPFADGEALRLWEVGATAAALGPVTVSVRTSSAALPVTAVWFDRTVQVGGLAAGAARVTTDASGSGRLDLQVASTGYYAVVVYRDPAQGLGAVNVTIEVERTPPDLVPHLASGWYAPLVPRPANDGTPLAVAAPDTLRGNTALTYLNLAVRNASQGASPSHTATVRLDGTPLLTLEQAGLAAGESRTTNLATAQTVRGGRHTLSLRLDAGGQIEEGSEANNFCGEQWVWSPVRLRPEAPVTRAAPPPFSGGWEDVTSGEALYPNCDGLRYDFTGATWQAAAVMPAADADVDIRVFHPRLLGAKNGFAAPRAWSAWGAGRSDFVLTNVRNLGGTSGDVGVTARETSTRTYVSENVASQPLDFAPGHEIGPFLMGGGRMLHLYELRLPAGDWTFWLLGDGGEIDWGMSIYDAERDFFGKSAVVEPGISYRHGPGQGESFSVFLPVEGRYCLAVWKVGAADLAREGRYGLVVQDRATDVPDLPPTAAVTTLVTIEPNPFNPQTRIVYDLAAAGRACVAVHDLRGQRLRTLVDAVLPAGRHVAIWDGRDDAGRPVASGVYLGRLEAGEIRQMRKMLLLK